MREAGPEVIKLFSMLNSAEHEILNTQKYKNIKKFSFSMPSSDKPIMLNFMLSSVEHGKSFITSGPGFEHFFFFF